MLQLRTATILSLRRLSQRALPLRLKVCLQQLAEKAEEGTPQYNQRCRVQIDEALMLHPERLAKVMEVLGIKYIPEKPLD